MRLKGKGVSAGFAVGPLRFIRQLPLSAERRVVENSAHQLERFSAARSAALDKLRHLENESRVNLGEENAQLFEIHRMMLEDADLNQAVTDAIEKEHLTAECAVSDAAKTFSEMFHAMDDEYMKARAADVEDVMRRVMAMLLGVEADSNLHSPAVLVSEMLTPSDTARFDPTMILGFITIGGSVNSHAAIFARQLGIPAVIGADASILEASEGDIVALNGTTGDIILSPDEQTAQHFDQMRKLSLSQDEQVRRFCDTQCHTAAGKQILVCANIAKPEEALLARANGADGVGLFRSEFLYMGRTALPDEQTQYLALCKASEAMDGRKLVVRTIDIGSDKSAKCLTLPAEENPALGLRGIRVCMRQPELLRTQLRAIQRAAYDHELSVMLPMVSDVRELEWAKEMSASVSAQLQAEGIPHKPDIKIGVMIETPAAAIMSDVLAESADFFSIGSNDLTQYTLAADRLNESVSGMFSSGHSSVLRLIEMTVKNAHTAGIPVSICGELGADLELTETFLNMGMDSISVNPPSVPLIKKKLCELGCSQ